MRKFIEMKLFLNESECCEIIIYRVIEIYSCVWPNARDTN